MDDLIKESERIQGGGGGGGGTKAAAASAAMATPIFTADMNKSLVIRLM